MEAFKDFITEFKERLTSPLFGSFIISWILFNWEIPVILIFFKQDDLYRILQPSYIDAIRNQYDICRCFFYPSIAAIFYTFGYPYLRNEIKRFQAARTLEVDSAILKKSGEGFVSIAKHQVLEAQLRTKVEQLTSFYENQTAIELRNEELIAKIAAVNETLEQQKVDSQKRLDTSLGDLTEKIKQMSGNVNLLQAERDAREIMKHEFDTPDTITYTHGTNKLNGTIAMRNNLQEVVLTFQDRPILLDSLGRTLTIFPNSGNYDVHGLTFDLLKMQATFFIISTSVVNQDKINIYVFNVILVKKMSKMEGKINGDVAISIY